VMIAPLNAGYSSSHRTVERCGPHFHYQTERAPGIEGIFAGTRNLLRIDFQVNSSEIYG
jgi:hypothetical protein